MSRSRIQESQSQGSSSRYQITRKCLLFWCVFIGIGAVLGASCMLIKPDGSLLQMEPMLPYFQVLPLSQYLYQNYLFPGIALLIVNGLTNLTAAFFILKKDKKGDVLGMIFGITLMLWICIQFVIFPANVLSTTYFIFGLIQAATGYACITFYKQEHFSFTEQDYKEIDPSSKTLVLYFSRMGYVKKVAHELANKEKAAIYQVKAQERTEGTLGFWWCGRFGMHGWPMKIQPLTINPQDYERVVICTPIWVFRIAGPIRQLCMELKGKVNNVSYVIVHYEKSAFSQAAAEMDRLLGVTHQSAYSICCKKGSYRFHKELVNNSTV